METKNLQRRQISMDAYDWYMKYLNAIDSKDLKLFESFLADDCVMVQNNYPPISGKKAIVTSLEEYWKTFNRMTHDLLNIYGRDDAFALEAWNHYVRLDGERVSVRAVALTDRNESGLVTQFRFYTDAAPVFQSKNSQP